MAEKRLPILDNADKLPAVFLPDEAALDVDVVHLTGNETVAGTKTFTSEPVFPAAKVPATRTITAGTGLSGGGDLSANRTLAVSYGTTAGTAAQGNDSRITGAASTAYVAGRVSGLTGLKKMLADANRSAAIQVLSDSTANGVTPSDYDWPHLLGQKIAALYPAWTVQHRLWNDTNQDFDAPLTIQTGTAGARYLDCDSGTAGLRLDTAASPHISGVIDVRVKVRQATWTPAAGSGFSAWVVKGSASPAISWRFGLANSGLLNFFYSTNGTTSTGIGSTANMSAAGVTAGSTKWVRCVFTPDDGGGNRVAQFYTSDDNVTWTQLGTTVTTAGTVTVFNETTVGYQLGALDTALSPGCDLFEVQIRNGLNGPCVTPCLPDGWGIYGGATTNAQILGAPILTLVNGCNPGSGISYLGDSTRLPKLTPDYGQAVIFTSTSHNETRKMGAQWLSTYNSWISSIRARLPQGSLIPLTQNPELPAAQYSGMHTQRRLDLIAWARSAGLDVIDTYGAFLADGRDLATVLLFDNIHPSVTGAGLWADTLMAELALAG